jgi:hypothetical protein
MSSALNDIGSCPNRRISNLQKNDHPIGGLFVGVSRRPRLPIFFNNLTVLAIMTGQLHPIRKKFHVQRIATRLVRTGNHIGHGFLAGLQAPNQILFDVFGQPTLFPIDFLVFTISFRVHIYIILPDRQYCYANGFFWRFDFDSVNLTPRCMTSLCGAPTSPNYLKMTHNRVIFLFGYE